MVAIMIAIHSFDRACKLNKDYKGIQLLLIYIACPH